MSTKAVAVKKALKTLLDGMPIVSEKDIQVTYGFPGKAPQRKWAVVGGIQWGSSEWATNRSRQEEFTVSVIFSAVIQASNSEETEEYVIAMASDFEEKLKADPSLNGLCVSTGFTPKSLQAWPNDTTSYEAQFETEVSATCRP